MIFKFSKTRDFHKTINSFHTDLYFIILAEFQYQTFSEVNIRCFLFELLDEGFAHRSSSNFDANQILQVMRFDIRAVSTKWDQWWSKVQCLWLKKNKLLSECGMVVFILTSKWMLCMLCCQPIDKPTYWKTFLGGLIYLRNLN